MILFDELEFERKHGIYIFSSEFNLKRSKIILFRTSDGIPAQFVWDLTAADGRKIKTKNQRGGQNLHVPHSKKMFIGVSICFLRFKMDVLGDGRVKATSPPSHCEIRTILVLEILPRQDHGSNQKTKDNEKVEYVECIGPKLPESMPPFEKDFTQKDVSDNLIQCCQYCMVLKNKRRIETITQGHTMVAIT